MARWALLTGGLGSHRSDAMRRLAAAVRATGRVAAGFTQRRLLDDDGVRTGLQLERVTTGESTTLARRAAAGAAEHEQTYCEMLFDRRAFQAGARWVDQDAAGADVLLLDELAKVEAGGGGHTPAARRALRCPPAVIVVLAVRGDQLAAVMDRLDLSDEPVATLELPADDDAVDAFAAALR
ncbi:MAG: DUF2478 domain-containing protein [Deltaproteobacteria bacterium]|nr:DUF2478 domain-containing protein [Deltaproteobacteria bacterium]